MKTTTSKFYSVNPRYKTLEDCGEEGNFIYTFEEENFVWENHKILRSSLTEPQFSLLKSEGFKPHRLFVQVFTRPDLRSGNHFTMMAGMSQIKAAFDGSYIYPTSENYYMEYPERWLNLVEQRALYPLLHLTFPNSTFLIKTHSVYIIQCTGNRQIGIYDKTDIDETDMITYDKFKDGAIVTCHKFKGDGELSVY